MKEHDLSNRVRHEEKAEMAGNTDSEFTQAKLESTVPDPHSLHLPFRCKTLASDWTPAARDLLRHQDAVL